MPAYASLHETRRERASRPARGPGKLIPLFHFQFAIVSVHPSMSRERALLLAAVVVLLGGLATSARSAATSGLDFASLYVMGRGILTGTNIYDPAVAATFPAKYNVMVPAGMFYPPATGFAMLPFAVFPFQLGKLLWFVTLTVVLLWGIRSLIRQLAPAAPSHVWMFAAGVIFASSALRWAMLLLQGAPLVLGLLCWFVAALHSDQRQLSTWLAVVAVAAKMTLALPFLGLLLFATALQGSRPQWRQLGDPQRSRLRAHGICCVLRLSTQRRQVGGVRRHQLTGSVESSVEPAPGLEVALLWLERQSARSALCHTRVHRCVRTVADSRGLASVAAN